MSTHDIKKKKNYQQSRIEGSHLNITKATYDKLTAHIILNVEKLEAFPLRLRATQVCLLVPPFFNMVLEVLAIVVR